MLGNPIVLAGTLSMFLLQAANVGLAVYLPVYLQSVLGLSASASGIGMLGLLLGTVAGATFSGRTDPALLPLQADRHGRRRLQHGCAWACWRWSPDTRLAGWWSSCWRSAIGIGAGTAFPVSTVSVQNAVDQAHLGVATGVLTFLRSLGGALGVAMLGAVALGYGLPLGRRRLQLTAAPVASATPFAMIFLVSAALMCRSLVALALMPEKPLRGTQDTPPVGPE